MGARCSGGLFGKHEQRAENTESVQCLKSDRSCLAANVGASHVGARSKRKHLPAMGAGGRAVDMDLLITIVQIVKDLLGSLNPFRLFKRDYRASFRDLGRQEPRVFRIAYVLGMLCLLVLLALVALAVWRDARI